MSDESLFAGRQFAIPYTTNADAQAASMARANVVTRAQTPGTVLQVGDKVVPIGITQQQAMMGNIDVRLRSYEQLSQPAQEAVRQNIQWQYGEQVHQNNVIEKGIMAKIGRALGMDTLFPTATYEKPSIAPVNNMSAPAPVTAPNSAPAATTPGAPPAAAPVAAPKKSKSSKKAAPAAAAPAVQPAPPAATTVTASTPVQAPKRARKAGGKAVAAAASAMTAPAPNLANLVQQDVGDDFDVFESLPSMHARITGLHEATDMAGLTHAHEYHHGPEGSSVHSIISADEDGTMVEQKHTLTRNRNDGSFMHQIHWRENGGDWQEGHSSTHATRDALVDHMNSFLPQPEPEAEPAPAAPSKKSRSKKGAAA